MYTPYSSHTLPHPQTIPAQHTTLPLPPPLSLSVPILPQPNLRPTTASTQTTIACLRGPPAASLRASAELAARPPCARSPASAAPAASRVL